MAELMLKPDWPGTFRRSVGSGKKSRTLVFERNKPVEVTAADLQALRADIGLALFEVERDEKGRPRFVETIEPEPNPTRAAMETEGSVANV